MTRWNRCSCSLASTTAGISVALWATVGAGSASAADVYDIAAELLESQPVSYRPVEVRVTGMSTSCQPVVGHVTRTENAFGIVLYVPSGSCADVIGPWERTVELGTLETGSHEVQACVLGHGCSTKLGFEVTDTVAAGLFGARQSRVVCRNLTTGQRIVVAQGVEPVDCEGAGLTVGPGDKVSVRLFGTIEQK